MIVTNPIVFLYNTLILFATMSIAFICKRKLFVYGTVGFVWLLLAIINFVVLYSRKTPFTAMDIYLINDAIKVVPLYLNLFQMILIVIAVTGAIAGLVYLFIKAPRYTGKIGYAKKGMEFAVVIAMLYYATNLFLASGFLSKNFGNLANAYKTYGFAYSFSCSVVGRGIRKDNEYSSEYMNSLKETLDNKEAENSESHPNVIFLQLESFFDPNFVEGTKYSENPVPEFERLVRDYSSGYLSVPVFGAGTANTEFEVQTGMNMDDFGPGEYPYKTVMQTKICESMAYNLSELGYATHALHNNDGTFYDRYKIFSHLGYQTYTSIEYMQNIEKTPMGWAKDKILTSEIAKILDTTEESDYIYAISVQGHGDYPNDITDETELPIKVKGFFDESNKNAFRYYVNEVHEMDLFVKELTDYLSQRDEETVLVMYGDHLPGFAFDSKTLQNQDIYQTQYVIWSNFDMPNEKRDLQAYQLSAYVSYRLGINNGYINKFHQQFLETNQEPTEEYLKNLKILEYDLLYGDADIYNGKVPYVATQLQMGTDEIDITQMYNYNDTICIEGKNFNEYSSVLINDEAYSTEIVSDRLLRVSNHTLKPGDVVSVIQSGKDKIELSRVYQTYGE